MNSRSSHSSSLVHLTFAFFIFSNTFQVAVSFAQDVKYPKNYEVKSVQVLSANDEKEQREGMKAEGIPAPTIDRIIEERKIIRITRKNSG